MEETKKPERILASAVRGMLLEQARKQNCRSDEILWLGADPADQTKHVFVVEEGLLNCYDPEEFGISEEDLKEIPVNSFLSIGT